MPKRNTAISIIRVMSMIIIVAYHCMCYNAGIWARYSCNNVNENIAVVAKIFVSIALPMFFFISGYVYSLNIHEGKYKNGFAFVYKKYSRLIVPTIFFTIIYCMLFPRDYRFMEIISGVGHLWFLPTLFICFLLTYSLNSIFLNNRRIMGGAFLMLVCILSCYSDMFVNINIQYAVCKYLVFFVFGVFIYPINSLMKLNKKLLILLILLSFVGHFINMWQESKMSSLVDIFCLCILMLSILGLITQMKVKESPVLCFLDKNSLKIYLIHQPLIMLLYEYSSFEELYLTPHPYRFIPILFIVVLLVSVSLSMGMARLRL